MYAKERDLFGFKETITLYDLTNTYFEGKSSSNQLAKYGHSKEKCSDCPLVTLGLVLDSSGFPKRSKVFKGNVNEALLKPTIVLDAGIATQDNIKWLKEKHYPYIVVSRKRDREFNAERSIIVKQNDDYIVRAQKIIDPETSEALLYCHSTRREKKEQDINNHLTMRFQEAMSNLQSGLYRKRCIKKYDKVLEQTGLIKQKFPKIAKQYEIQVIKDRKTGHLATKIFF